MTLMLYVLLYICKTQIDVQPLIDVQSSNTCQISTSQTSVPQIGVQFSKLSFFKISNRHPILKSMAVSHFLKSTSNDTTDVCPNPNQ